MLEGDELFENSSDTAYKVCCSFETDADFVPWNRVFSAHWDPTDSDRIVLCSQNGQIRMQHRSSRAEKTFTVKFRRYLSSVHSESKDAKTVNYHFDKMCLLPNRPGEFIFLLGVSKTMMYSALPGYCTGDLSNSCRSDSSSYGNGCPVFQLVAHSARITAMAASGTGHILSSGDEHGNLKIINIFKFRADKSNQVMLGRENAAASKIREPQYTDQLSVSLKGHNATVYAIHWLPLMYGQRKDRVSCLVTGSDDRVVKLWRVQSTNDKLLVQPLLLLSVMASCVLCINSCFIPGSSSVAYADMPVLDVTSSSRTAKDRVYEHRGAVTILSAGTSSGAVYVWKIKAEDIFVAQQAEQTERSLAISQENSRLHTKLDDGSRLVGIIFASEKPVIHVAPAMSTESGVVLAVADVTGAIKFHKELKSAYEMEEDFDLGKDDKGLKIHPLVFGGGEKQFSTPVVSCVYQRLQEEELGAQIPEPTLTDTGLLLMCDTRGNVIVESVEYQGEFDEKSAGDINKDAGGAAGAALEEYFQSVTDQMDKKYPDTELDAKSHLIQQRAILEYGSDGSDDGGDGEAPRARSSPSPFPVPLPPVSVRADSVRSPLASRSKSPLPLAELSSVLKATGSSYLAGIKGGAISDNVASKSAGVKFASDTEDDSLIMIPQPPPVAQERPLSPPMLTMMFPVVEDTQRTAAHTKTPPQLMKQERLKKSHGIESRSSQSENERRGRVSSMHMQSSLEEQNPRPITADVGKSPKGVADTANEAPEGSSLPYERYKPLYTQDQVPGGNSDHSVPILHSSKVVAMQLEKLDEKIENDEFTISSIETSSTMRLKAAQRAVNIHPKSALYNYSELVQLEGAERQGKAQRRFNIPKQVDQEWLSRKHNFSLSEDERKVLYPSDPLVHIKLQYNFPVGPTKVDTSGGVVSYIDENTLMPKFNLCVDPEKVFGRVPTGELDTIAGGDIFSMKSLDFLCS